MLISINPYTGEQIEKFNEYTKSEVNNKLKHADRVFQSWKITSYAHKADLMKRLEKVLEKNKQAYAETMVQEMGKPISQAISEIEKCAWVCRYYAENAKEHLKNEPVETEAQNSYIRFEPLGVVLAVMPWNYPFWQVFRFAAPALMAGNVAVLKHAGNVIKSAENIQNAFLEAGFPEGCFQNLIVKHKKVEHIIRNKYVKAVTLTGSEAAGRSVAGIAGQEIKKSVLELGGSNALVVFEDAKLDETVETCVMARFQNTGQSCIAGKRLLVHESIFTLFLEKFLTKVRSLKIGDPMDEETFIGVLARKDLAKKLEAQLAASVEKGAKIVLGGKRKGAFFEPTVVINVNKKMPIFKEETFGPLMAMMPFKTDMEAMDLVNKSNFGLGVSIFTEDMERAKAMIPNFDDGAVFVNELVKSDPRLPFGGTKISGYGRELSRYGILEFVNKKTVYFK